MPQSGLLVAHLGTGPQQYAYLTFQEGLPPPGTPFAYLARPVHGHPEDQQLNLSGCMDPGNILGALSHILESLSIGEEQDSANVQQLAHGEMPGGT